MKIVIVAWSKERFRDIFQELIINKEIVRLKENFFEENPTARNRVVLQKAQAELKRYLHFEEEFWWQKVGMQWFSEGDGNTRLFHNLVIGRKRRLPINRIIKKYRKQIEGN